MPTAARRSAAVIAALACAAAAGGCATLKMPTWPWSAAAQAEGGDSTVISSEHGPPRELGWDPFKAETLKKRWKKMTGRGPDEEIARQALADGDALFSQGRYRDAIPKYQVAIDRWPDSDIEEDAMWQLAECLFFTDRYPKAEDAYDELVKKYANTRHLDRVARRQFVIGQYWIALDQKRHLPLLVPNLVDGGRPLFDTKGRALKAFDHVRLNDPRGPLADDSLMAQANSHFLDRQWLDADYFYGLLRSDYPDSEFLLDAHLLGLQAKLRAYQGPGYEGGVLEEAEVLADQTLVQFPDQLSRDDDERVQRTRAEIAAQQAQRLWKRAEFYAKGEHYTSARMYYAMLAKDYPTTQLAQQARGRFDQIRELADATDDPFPALSRLLNPDKLRDAELDAMAEAETVIAREDGSGAGRPLY
ncbi:MAG: tetratricopeptide repeat protein [Planctomycetaceae bacterium]